MKNLVLFLPGLLACSPVLFLWKLNTAQVRVEGVLLILGIVVFATCLVHALMAGLFRDRNKAALGTSIIVVAFFLYGRIFDFVWSQDWFVSMRVLNWVLGGIFLLTGAFAFQLVRRATELRPLNRFLLITAGGFSCISILGIAFDSYHEAKKPSVEPLTVKGGIYTEGQRKMLTSESIKNPDIYYIILDGYARKDILSERYHYDNSSFLKSLSERGFYIGERSTSNYSMTFLSLASTLNMRYINKDGGMIGEKSRDHKPMYGLIQDNLVGRFIKSRGYKYVSVNTNWGGTEVSSVADIELEMCPRWMRSEFFSVLIRTTAARDLCPNVADIHRFSFDAVEKTALEPGPTFVFSHMLVPHNPYVFDEEGNERANIPLSLQWVKNTGGWKAKDDYVAQLSFTNKRVLQMIDEILAQSTVRPIIVLQSDHGSASSFSDKDQNGFLKERHAILNAFLVPEQIRSKLYPEITSVNTFRVIFSELFDVDSAPLEERNYFSWYKTPYKFRDVTEVIKVNSSDSVPAKEDKPISLSK